MQVYWDPAKARANLRKHGIRFSDAESVLYDSHAITREDRRAQGETRFVSVGSDAIGRVLVVAYAHRGDDLRLISARPATQGERRQYEEGV